MHWQTLFVALLVPMCALYAVWLLLPADARRGAAQQLLRLPLPRPLTQRLARVAAKANGCGCDGCDSPVANKPAAARDTAQRITIHRRR